MRNICRFSESCKEKTHCRGNSGTPRYFWNGPGTWLDNRHCIGVVLQITTRFQRATDNYLVMVRIWSFRLSDEDQQFIKPRTLKLVFDECFWTREFNEIGCTLYSNPLVQWVFIVPWNKAKEQLYCSQARVKPSRKRLEGSLKGARGQTRERKWCQHPKADCYRV